MKVKFVVNVGFVRSSFIVVFSTASSSFVFIRIIIFDVFMNVIFFCNIIFLFSDKG